jgi:YidC/Oxa1 family membrane protein insertase
MEKRVLLAVALSFLVLAGYQMMFPPPKPTESVPSSSTGQGSSASASNPSSPSPAEAESVAPTVPQETPLVGDREERDVVVENDAVRAVFSNRGAVLKSWILKHYKTTSGAPLDLVPQIVRGAPRPFSLLVEDAKASATPFIARARTE